MQLLQQQQQQQQNGSVQYVQLSNGMLVPTNSVVSPTTMANPNISTSLLQSQIVAATNQQLQQQQLQLSQQLQQAQQKKQLQEAQAQQQHINGTAKLDTVRSPTASKGRSSRSLFYR